MENDGSVLMGGMADLPDSDEGVVAGFNRSTENLIKDPPDEYVEVSRNPGFDPDVHVVGSDGEPVINKDGSYRRKRVRRKSSGDEEARALAVVSVETMEKVCVLAISPEWAMIKQEGIDEKQGLINAFDKFYEHHGVDDIPPNIALAIAVASYAIPRFVMERTQEKFKGFRGWFRKKLYERKMRKENARNDSRADAEWEEQSGDKGM